LSSWVREFMFVPELSCSCARGWRFIEWRHRSHCWRLPGLQLSLHGSMSLGQITQLMMYT
jgi:hypothetical protein